MKLAKCTAQFVPMGMPMLCLYGCPLCVMMVLCMRQSIQFKSVCLFRRKVCVGCPFGVLCAQVDAEA